MSSSYQTNPDGKVQLGIRQKKFNFITSTSRYIMNFSGHVSDRAIYLHVSDKPNPHLALSGI